MSRPGLQGNDRLVEVEAGYEAVSQDAYYQALYSDRINDKVGVRLVARYSDLNGYFKVRSVPSNGDPLITPAPFSRWPGGEEFFARATVLVEPNEALRIRPRRPGKGQNRRRFSGRRR
ncbi:hypothetical protein BBF93_04810 [Hyphomonas sp. CACIAM 19H1]|uniref:hypothetical protein n=1 Tax=Hyphomonas sp. CACIAM 19H1 TaxID=1873716 RepID=UPI000DED9169|nr:hypothetical protein [Hyphomonas sp. CACIAM 19H1]AXE63617.1 hypothetical protein BBF93_04810 [Hyphomonas sp. CACIAM 19H1]